MPKPIDIERPSNLSPENNAVNVNKTPTLVASQLLVNNGTSPTLSQSEWLVFQNNDVQLLDGEVTAGGNFDLGIENRFQNIAFDGSFTVGGTDVGAMGISAAGIIRLYIIRWKASPFMLSLIFISTAP